MLLSLEHGDKMLQYAMEPSCRRELQNAASQNSAILCDTLRFNGNQTLVQKYMWLVLNWIY